MFWLDFSLLEERSSVRDGRATVVSPRVCLFESCQRPLRPMELMGGLSSTECHHQLVQGMRDVVQWQSRSLYIE